MKIERLPEPPLLFREGSSTNCKTGVLAGPYSARRDSHRPRILLGLVGPKHLIEDARSIIQRFNAFIESRPIPKPGKTAEPISKILFPDFPGCPVAFDCNLVTDDACNAILSVADLAKLDRNNPFSYQEHLLRLMDEKMRLILESNLSGPDVLICLLTKEMYDIAHIVGDYHRPLRRRYVPDTQLNLFKDLDDFNPARVVGQDRPLSRSLRSSLKKLVMRPAIRIPVQIILEETLNPESIETQNLATKAWNFCTGLFYKAGNLPWVIEGLNEDTCYLGVSFFHKKDFYRDAVFTSMAHLFSNDFDGIVLKGERVDFDTSLRMPFLDYERAKSLIERGLVEYERIRSVRPRQLVIHKTSSFNEAEIRGFSEVVEANNIVYDLVSISKSSLRVLRYGRYPVPRGTLVSFGSEYDFLYTKGFIPELDTYPGVHVPLPLHVKKARGDSSIAQICKDILALTKLNWNTADFCCGLPITIGFARNVGHVFKEFDEADGVEKRGQLKPRSEAEKDSDTVQVIPCGIIRYDDEVMLLRRKEVDERHRLHDKYVIWAGGHIRDEDLRGEKTVVENCLERELNEELRIRTAFGYEPIGCVFDESTEKSARHVGLVFSVTMKSKEVAIHLQKDFKEFREGRGKSVSGKFFEIRGLDRKYIREMERWSLMLLKDYFKQELPSETNQASLFG